MVVGEPQGLQREAPAVIVADQGLGVGNAREYQQALAAQVVSLQGLVAYGREEDLLALQGLQLTGYGVGLLTAEVTPILSALAAPSGSSRSRPSGITRSRV